MSSDLFATPDISHLTSADYEKVYEPAEDTFLLLDALEKEYATLKALNVGLCLEVGCGSGTVSTFVAKMLGSSSFCLCTDINPSAADACRRTAHQNGVIVQPIINNLVDGLLPRLKHQVDLLLFNPPYVVTPSEEVANGGIEASWAGGIDGREVTDKFLPLVPQLLSDKGVFYLVAIRENKPDELAEMMAEHGLTMSVVMARRSGPEHLSILKFCRDSS